MPSSARRTFILWAGLALLWANLPYLIGYGLSTPQNHFGGFFLYEQDGYSYYAKMRQGAVGSWNFHLPYTSEDEYQSGGLVYPFYLTLGKLMPLSLSAEFLYQAARLLSSLLLLIVLARFIARFIPDRRWQLWTWWLILFSSGWGLLVSYLIDPKYVAYELIAPDGFLFSILYGPPHIVLGFALLLIWIGYTLDTLKSDAPYLARRILIANVLGGLTALSREAYGPLFAGVFIAYWALLVIKHRRILWREGVLIVLSMIAAGLYGLYLLIAFQTIPGLAVWYAQNPFTTPNLLDFGLGFAPLLILAIIGLRLKWRDSSLVTQHSSFLAAWLIAGPIMAYMPISISRRLIAGWQIPLCVLGAYALIKLVDSRRPLKQAIAIGLVMATLPTTLLVIIGGNARVTAQPPPLFQSADQLAALDWLSQHTTDRDVVLSDWHFGNLVPTAAGARVFIGHPIETAFFKDKLAQVDHFYDPSTSTSDRLAFLTRWSISLIVVGPDQLIELDPAEFTLAFRQDRYSIYQLKLTGAAAIGLPF
jgi:hypothetical protein